jgi:hypothetical protein
VPNDTTTAHTTPKDPPRNGTAPDGTGSRPRAPKTAPAPLPDRSTATGGTTDAVVVLALPAGAPPTWLLVAQVLDCHDIRDVATARWWTWQQHVAAITPPAQPWEHFRTEHDGNPARLSLQEAGRRFHAQPRLLAMLAYNSYPFNPHHLRTDELTGYQAGLTVYVALHWQRPLVGDALVTPTGVLLRPRSPSVADQLRYLSAATQVVHALTGSDHLVAVQAVLPPHCTS